MPPYFFQVGKQTYKSYPTEYNNPKDAEKYCADKAIQDIQTKYDKKRFSLLLTNDKDILERIPPMLEKHYHGEL